MSHIRFTIIIPTNNTRKALFIDTIQSVVENEIQKKFGQILIVNNSEQSPQWLIDCCERRSLFILHERKPGLHNARHTGAKNAKGEILIFLDDDVIVTEGWLQNILACFSDPSVAVVGGKVEPDWEATPPSWIYKTSPDYLSLLDYGDQVRQIRGKEGLNGCNFAIRREVLFEVKGFNPDGFPSPDMIWFRGDGEYGLIQKVLAKGYKVLYCPEALVYHRIPSERMSKSYFEKRAFAEGISRAFSLARKYDGSYFSIGVMIILSFFASLVFSVLRKTRRDLDWEIKNKLGQVRYSAMKQYGVKLLWEKNLYGYMRKAHYMEAIDE